MKDLPSMTITFTILFSLHSFAGEIISFSKASYLADESIQLQTANLQPGSEYEISTSAKDKAGRLWKSSAVFAANSKGTIDFNHTPISGSYKAGHSQGLFWSMVPENYQLDRDFFSPPEQYEIEVSLNQNKRILTKASTQRKISEGLFSQETSRNQNGYFDLIYPENAQNLPLVILLGGSEGGLGCGEGRLISSSGFAVLCLAYFKEDGLPEELSQIPLEYVESNIRKIQVHPKVDPKRVFIWGTSKGAELALLIASRIPDVIKGVVAVVPSHLIWQGIKEDNSQTSSWSFNGQALPFAPIIFDGQDFSEPPFKLRVGYDRTLNTISDLSFAEISVEKIAGPILLVSGTDDQVWPSSTMSERIVEKLKKNSFPYEVRHLKFESAGHFIGLPAWPTSGRIFGMMTAGGNSDADGIASADSRPQIMRFLKKISEE
jgi:predicted esterase